MRFLPLILLSFAFIYHCSAETFYVAHAHGTDYPKSWIQWEYERYPVHFYGQIGTILYRSPAWDIFELLRQGKLENGAYKYKYEKEVKCGNDAQTVSEQLWSGDNVKMKGSYLSEHALLWDEDVDLLAGIYKFTTQNEKPPTVELLYEITKEITKDGTVPITLSTIAEKLKQDEHPAGPIQWIACRSYSKVEPPAKDVKLLIPPKGKVDVNKEIEKRLTECIKEVETKKKEWLTSIALINDVGRLIAETIDTLMEKQPFKDSIKSGEFYQKISPINDRATNRIDPIEKIESDFDVDGCMEKIKKKLQPMNCPKVLKDLMGANKKVKPMQNVALTDKEDVIKIKKAMETWASEQPESKGPPKARIEFEDYYRHRGYFGAKELRTKIHPKRRSRYMSHKF